LFRQLFCLMPGIALLLVRRDLIVHDALLFLRRSVPAHNNRAKALCIGIAVGRSVFQNVVEYPRQLIGISASPQIFRFSSTFSVIEFPCAESTGEAIGFFLRNMHIFCLLFRWHIGSFFQQIEIPDH